MFLDSVQRSVATEALLAAIETTSDAVPQIRNRYVDVLATVLKRQRLSFADLLVVRSQISQQLNWRDNDVYAMVRSELKIGTLIHG